MIRDFFDCLLSAPDFHRAVILWAIPVLLGSLLSFLLFLGFLIRPQKAPRDRAGAGMMVSLGLWQGHTGLLLSEVADPVLVWTGPVQFLAALAFPVQFWAFGYGLLRPDDSGKLVRWLTVGVLLAGLAFLVYRLKIMTPDLFGIRSIAAWSHVDSPHRDWWLYTVSYLPRLASVLVAMQLIWIAWRNRELAPGPARFWIPFLAGLGGVGTTLCVFAQYQLELDGPWHGMGAAIISFSVCGLFLYLQRFPLASRTRKFSTDSQSLVLEIQSLMESERLFLVEDLTLASMAQALSEKQPISREKLSGIINTHWKQNFNQFVNGYRVQEACRRLIESDDSILSIAMDVGFNSKSVFNQAFRIRTGLSPGQYRKKNRSLER